MHSTRPHTASLADLAKANPIAMRGLHLLSNLAASAPLRTENPDGPPPANLTRQAVERCVWNLHTIGEAWLRPDTLQVLHVDRVEYEGNAPATVYTKGKTYRADELIEVRSPDPADHNRNAPILTEQPLRHFAALQRWNESITKGGGKVPGYWTPTNLQPGEQLSTEQVEQAEASINASVDRARRMGRFAVLSGAFTPHHALTPQDADWHGATEILTRQIATQLGIHPALIGGQDESRLTDKGRNALIRNLYLLTVLPLLQSILDPIAERTLQRGQRLTYDRNKITALTETVSALWERYGKAYTAQVITRDEARTALRI